MLKDREHVSALLKRGQWFDGLPEKLQELILDRAVDRSYAKRETIVREGEIGRGLCAVLEGRVNTVARGGAEREMLIHVAEPGYWFGIFDILSDGAPRPDTAYADTNARILLLSTASFKDIVEMEPRYYPYFAKLLIERYVIVYRFLVDSHGLPTEEWLHARLAALAAFRRKDEAGTGPVWVAASQDAIATMIGVSRQTLSILLARLEDRGLIEVGFRGIRILG